MSTWNDCVTAALLGSERATVPALPAGIANALGETADPEARFLTEIGAMALWQRAGWKPSSNHSEITASEPDSALPLSNASISHLGTMIDGRFASLLPEWLQAVVNAGQLVTPVFLPALLDCARQDRDLRPLVMAAGGHRSEWLAQHNPDWAFAVSDSEAHWETGSRAQRVRILRALRATNPGDARAKLEAVWKTEPADLRTEFLEALHTGLSSDDVPFLESALDDRSKEVRRVAARLLSRLPDSPLVARMLARATPLVTWKPGRLLSRGSLEVTLPDDSDAAALRDDVDAKAFGSQKILGPKAVLLVIILSAVPLTHWTTSFDLSPAELLKAAEKSEFGRALATGWARAAVRQRDAVWAEVLLDGSVQPHIEFIPHAELLGVLPESARADRLKSAIRGGGWNNFGNPEWLALSQQLLSLPAPMPLELGRTVLTALQRNLAEGLPWQLKSQVEAILFRLPPALLPDAASMLPAQESGVSELIELIEFRREALSAFKKT